MNYYKLARRLHLKKMFSEMVLLTFLLLPVLVYAEAPLADSSGIAVAAKEVSAGDKSAVKKQTGAVRSAASGRDAESEEIAQEEGIADPLEPWNRLMFTFNDRVYFLLMKPASKVYNAVVPEPFRVSVNNFFSNLTTPVRFVNCLLQLQMKCAGIELVRLGVNSTLGIGGLVDAAKYTWQLDKQDKDLGQTLGYYGIGDGFYIIWPFLGPSSLRDTVGLVGDGFLTPQHYITPFIDALAVEGYYYFNYNALHIGEYEDFKESAIEPYVALRDAFSQHRKSLYKKDQGEKK
ncbi:MAG TPA: VacJ family lipoprotein [Thermodesulfovibrionales bacterium]|nr:VacJ family lipoprotein [Thermodesulfovibrionales bacterium]